MRILSIVGARPQFIKVAPVLWAIMNYNKKHRKKLVESILLHTGQHYDDNMSKIFFEELLIPKINVSDLMRFSIILGLV